jgi:hypothetical protein
MRIHLGLVSIVALTFLVFGPTVRAQQPDAPTVQSRGGGEMNSAHLDALAVEQASSQERIFIIARLGNGETSNALNQLRLQAARAYLIGTRGMDPAKLVFAASEKVDGEGRVEFYLGSRLALISLAQRNRNVVLSCCGDTVPQLPRHPRRRR